MQAEGPLLESLTRRLSECPEEFVLEPRMKDSGTIDVAAVVCDALRSMGVAPDNLEARKRFLPAMAGPVPGNWLRTVCVAVWLLHDEWFRSRRDLAPAIWQLLCTKLQPLAAVVKAELFVHDADRREELARFCLAALGLRPQGESVTQAADRLTTLDSIERVRVVREARKAEERTRQVREAMAKRAAEAAAAKVSRE